jgi:hypothetical protein
MKKNVTRKRNPIECAIAHACLSLGFAQAGPSARIFMEKKKII